MECEKTAVSILQELAVAERCPLPEYILEKPNPESPDKQFRYQVSYKGQIGVGAGKSKKEAKQQAAKQLLEKLPKENDTDVTQPKKKMKLTSGIADLHSFCIKNKLPLPTYMSVSEAGPDHCKEFTYQCAIMSVRTTATAHSKKEAQHYAAKEMLDRISNIVPDLITEYNNWHTSLSVKNKEIEDQSCTKSKPKPDSSAKVKSTVESGELDEPSSPVNRDTIKEFVNVPDSSAKTDKSTVEPPKLEEPIMENEAKEPVEPKPEPDSSANTNVKEEPTGSKVDLSGGAANISAVEKVCEDLCEELGKDTIDC